MTEYRRVRDGNTYFFTAVTFKRHPFLCGDEARRALREIIDEVRRRHPFEVKGWVLLPDHLHCMWELPEGDTDYSMRWGLIKKEFTKRMKGRIETSEPGASRRKKREAAVWQRRFWEHRIRDERDYMLHLDYIHYNPVKHGLVRAPRDWKHSTFRRYVEEGAYPADWGSGGIDLPEVDGGE